MHLARVTREPQVDGASLNTRQRALPHYPIVVQVPKAPAVPANVVKIRLHVRLLKQPQCRICRQPDHFRDGRVTA